jgi:hypothetical protein
MDRVRNSAKVDDATFLADEFNIPERNAARLVTPPGQVDAIAAEVSRRRKEDDPLAAKPTPQEPERDLVPDNDEERLKPVLHHPNERRGGG